MRFFVIASLCVMTAARDLNCGCDHRKRVVKCSRMELADFKENTIMCGHFENIDISENNIRKFPSDLRQFRSVNISLNSLKDLDVSVNQKLELLDVTGNYIIEINLKDYFHNLRHLNASKNNLGFVNENFIRGHCNLIHLDVSGNIIMSLQPVIKCMQLSVLLAARNVISDLPDSLSSLTNLKTLDLSRNKLTYVHGLPAKLETLDLSGNRIARLKPTMFQGLASLTYLDLDGNKINIIEPGTFSSLGSLEILKLNSNDMKILTSEMFQGLISLKVAEFCYSLIVKISGDTFSDLPALETLMLVKNEMVTLPALRLGKNVKVVQIMWNRIERLNFRALKTMFSGSAVPRRVSFPLNKFGSEDPGWSDVVREFDWECVYDFSNYIDPLLDEAPLFKFPRSKESGFMTAGKAPKGCGCVRFSNKRGMTFDTCVNGNEDTDGTPWLVAVDAAARENYRYEL